MVKRRLPTARELLILLFLGVYASFMALALYGGLFGLMFLPVCLAKWFPGSAYYNGFVKLHHACGHWFIVVDMLVAAALWVPIAHFAMKLWFKWTGPWMKRVVSKLGGGKQKTEN